MFLRIISMIDWYSEVDKYHLEFVVRVNLIYYIKSNLKIFQIFTSKIKSSEHFSLPMKSKSSDQCALVSAETRNLSYVIVSNIPWESPPLVNTANPFPLWEPRSMNLFLSEPSILQKQKFHGCNKHFRLLFANIVRFTYKTIRKLGNETKVEYKARFKWKHTLFARGFVIWKHTSQWMYENYIDTSLLLFSIIQET